jgi:hypothetical protein
LIESPTATLTNIQCRLANTEDAAGTKGEPNSEGEGEGEGEATS